MKIERTFTSAGQDAYAALDFVTTVSEIRNPDGTIVFHLDNVEVPAKWSQVASDVIAQKYFRKAGVPSRVKKVKEKAFLNSSGALSADGDDVVPAKPRPSKCFDRLAGAWAYWGWKGGYFTTEADAKAYFDEMRYMLASQRAAPNSPQWFNTGLHWAYGIDGPAQGHHYVDYKTGKLTAPHHPMSTRSRTPASFSPCPTIWSTTAASWTSGSAKPVCSNTAPAQAPTFPHCAPLAKPCPVAASPPASWAF